MSDRPSFDPHSVIDAMAPLLGIPVDPSFRPGIVANLELIAMLAALLDAAPIDEREEPAAVFRP